jgi:hypothetical protein
LNLKGERIESVLFTNYKNNLETKKNYMQIIKENLKSLGNLGPLFKNGRRIYISFNEKIVFDYFINHKTYKRHVYQEDYEAKTQLHCPQKKRRLHIATTIRKKKKANSIKKLSDFVDIDVENFVRF